MSVLKNLNGNADGKDDTVKNGGAKGTGRSFNLVDQPWIPVTDAAGQRRLVGLRSFFEESANWTDLAVGTLERIAILRFLICIVHRALDGPKNRAEWNSADKRMTAAAVQYMDQWKDRFDLFGERPFLQIRTLVSESKSNDTPKTDKLDFALATGNSKTLFDPCAVEEGRLHDPGWLARKLLVFQSFSPGGRIGVALWNGKPTEGNGSSNNAPCMESNMLFTILTGNQLRDTIHWNLIPFDSLPLPCGKPIWEYDLNRLSAAEKEEIRGSWFGRLVPLARTVRLDENGRDMVLANGLTYPTLPAVREPMGSVFVRLNKKKEEWKYVRTDPNQHPWRNLHALLAHRKQNAKGAAVLKNIPAIVQSGRKIDSYELWIGGIASDKAKIIDTADWNITIDVELLGDTSLANYEKGVKMAKNAEFRLVRAVKTYCDHLKLDPQKEERKGVSSLAIRAKSLFWSAMDHEYQTLLEESQKKDGTLPRWRDLLKGEIDDAYSKTCPHRTARQLQAFVEGKGSLYHSSVKKEPGPNKSDSAANSDAGESPAKKRAVKKSAAQKPKVKKTKSSR